MFSWRFFIEHISIFFKARPTNWKHLAIIVNKTRSQFAIRARVNLINMIAATKDNIWFKFSNSRFFFVDESPMCAKSANIGQNFSSDKKWQFSLLSSFFRIETEDEGNF